MNDCIERHAHAAYLDRFLSFKITINKVQFESDTMTRILHAPVPKFSNLFC